MEAELTYLLQMCTDVPTCHSLSVGVCQSNKQNRLGPSVFVNGVVPYQ